MLSSRKGKCRLVWRGDVTLSKNIETKEDVPAHAGTSHSLLDHVCGECSLIDWKALATLLHLSICGVRTLNKRSTPTRWWVDIKWCHFPHGVPAARVKRVIQDYCHYIKKEGQIRACAPHFVPEVMAATTLRATKNGTVVFDSLEKQLRKMKDEDGPHQPPRATSHNDGPTKYATDDEWDHLMNS